ncbi:MAG: 16S rRNA (adenine(1518)-N(6)/adenine(1519)-N(6))-dimethyltransferase RsmA [Candidatus Dormibacteria bacterium]
MAPEPAPPDLTDPAVVQGVARRVRLWTKHRLGQHFLVDAEARQAIVDALDPQPEDAVLEIGPGIGTLTQALAGRAGRVVAVELDPACIRAAAITLRGHDNIEVLQGDALRVRPASAGLPERYLAAGNLPYNLTTALLSHLFEAEHPPRRAVFLVQREVAIRLAADPGDWGLATVAIRSIAHMERLRDVPPSSFLPPPAVHSSIIRMTPAAVLSEEDRRNVLTLARGAFQLRRKTLRHGVGRALGGDIARAMRVLDAAGIDASRRPETLDLEEWRSLSAAVETTA